MADDRVNIKVPPEVHTELDDTRDMSWPDQLLHWKRVTERDGSGDWVGSEVTVEPIQPDYKPVLDRLDDLESRLPRKVAEELRR